jgi:chorismate mutase
MDILLKKMDMGRPAPGAEVDDFPFVIAGPCSAESEEQVLTTATQLAGGGCRYFRAGVWKPRTKPGCFEGHGEKALPWLKEVKKQTGMHVLTEVATPEHVEQCLKHGIDMLWVGARTVTNPFAMQALADSLRGVDIPILVKNPMNPDLELWIGALERLYVAGVCRLGAIHRGFSIYDAHVYRNSPMWQIPIELRRRLPDLPIFCDPSHIGGHRELIAVLSQQAMDMGFDGLFVETHCRPDEAWSDAAQQITPEELGIILRSLVIRNNKNVSEGINQLREQIDLLDDRLLEVLAERMKLCREIGHMKKESNMTVVQPQRYNEMLNKRSTQGVLGGMDEEFIRRIFKAIHEESVRQQIEIINR